jgi:hypothetical protein
MKDLISYINTSLAQYVPSDLTLINITRAVVLNHTHQRDQLRVLVIQHPKFPKQRLLHSYASIGCHYESRSADPGFMHWDHTLVKRYSSHSVVNVQVWSKDVTLIILFYWRVRAYNFTSTPRHIKKREGWS